MNIHPSAIVHPNAKLADDVEVQAFSIIDAHVTIGAGTVVGPHCVVKGRTVIGRNNHFFSGSNIGVLSQDLKQQLDLVGKVVIGDNNQFREFTTVSASALYSVESEDDPKKVTTVGSGCLFMANSHIAHDCHVGDGVIMANSVALSGHVEVEDRAIIGGLTGVHQFCVVGRQAFIGGMTRVTKDVLPYMLIEGSPARCHGPNSVGLERGGMDKDARRRVKAIYRLLYRAGLNTTHALERIEAEVAESDERRVMVGFVRRSERGLTK